jgi:hypothetical protein
MAPTFVVYIDESGDEGFSFGRGSSEWFVLCAVITKKANDLETVMLVDEARSQLGKRERQPLHFRDLRHEQRLPLVARIAKADLRTICICVHKPSLSEPETFQERFRLYFYTARYLLERVSWYCRDHTTARDTGDGSAQIIFSNRSGMSYDELRTYLHELESRSHYSDIRIEWWAIRPEQIAAYPPARRLGLQIADAVAGSFYYAIEFSQHGFTEDRYARMLIAHCSDTGTDLGLSEGPKSHPGMGPDVARASRP